MKKVIFIKNAVVLTVTALLLRSVGIFFRVWLAGRIGAEGIGLYQMIFSVYMLAATFASSGLCTAVTRLVTDRLALGDKKGALRAMKSSAFLTLIVAAVSMVIIYFFAESIAIYLVKDARATIALKVLCLSLPFMGLSSCIKGYFMARRRAVPPSASQILEQIVRISVMVWLIGLFAPYGIGAACTAVLLGDTAAEAVSMLFLYLCYKSDKKKLKGDGTESYTYRKILKETFHIAVPITAGRYLNTLLRTIENLLVPSSLTKFTLSRKDSLEQFGMIKGMALPILFFPASLLNSMSTLLIPEMSEALAQNNTRTVKAAVNRAFQITLVMAFLISGVFFVTSSELGQLIYNSREVGSLLRALSPLIPVMYIDSVADGMLKGLDQQAITFRNSVLDSASRIVLIVFLVPRFGMIGFLGIMFYSNLLTAFLNVYRLLKVSKVRFQYGNWFIKPLISAFTGSFAAFSACRFIKFYSPILYIIAVTVVASAIYFILMFLFRALSREDVEAFLP